MIKLDDFLKPQIEQIARGLKGKCITIYGGNNLGKTKQTTKLPKPYVLACENGGVYNVPKKDISEWKDFSQAVDFLSSERTKKIIRESYETIIVDGIESLANMLNIYVCDTYLKGAPDLGAKDNKDKDLQGVNGYKIYEKLIGQKITDLVLSGFTVVFIGHEEEKKEFISLKGEKRLIAPIVNNCDIVVYLKSSGVDENYRPLNSTAYLFQTKDYFARCRYAEANNGFEFTIENLDAEIALAIEKEEANGGFKALSYEDSEKIRETKKIKANFENTLDKIYSHLELFEEKSTGTNDLISKAVTMYEGIIGVGKKISECTETQLEALDTILFKLTNLAEENNISIDTATE